MVDAAALRSELERLASNLRWAWHPPARQLFADLAPGGWEAAGRDPAGIVASLGDDELRAIAAEPRWVERIRHELADLDTYLGADDTWFDRSAGDRERVVAYLSAEFALADCLHTFSGGLGVLAGDHLRSASDLGVPMVGVSLAYRDGYFRQRIDPDGRQLAEPAANRWDRLPVRPVVDAHGDRVTVAVEMGDGVVRVQAWLAQVGRVPVYLLDSDVDGNTPQHRSVTGHLYGGDRDTRLRQELVLGVGGVRMLAAVGVRPAVLHLNEGHAAFAGLERLRSRLAHGMSLTDAVADARCELVFTTHTPVPAGHDRFTRSLAELHLVPLAQRMGVRFEDLLELATGPGEPEWNQTVLALRLAGRSNGVARLHGHVTRQMWAHLWPGRPVDEVPIDHVTNGVHVGRWVGSEIRPILARQVGPGWEHRFEPGSWDAIGEVDPSELWTARTAARRRLVHRVHAHLSDQAVRLGIGPDGSGLDPDALTIGFARRFATYKRATLITRDVDRLARLLGDPDRPVQLVVAGKAHPADRAGQDLITELVHLSRDPRLGGRLVVVEGYDLELGGLLTSGVDVWLNTPLRPLEASGTSGMKAALNGVLNLSVLDGWWDEAVEDLSHLSSVGFGWSIGDREERGDRQVQDGADAAALYGLLEEVVVPTFHERDGSGVPQRWTAMMRDAIRLLGPRFSTHRMVVDYIERYGVVPAALAAGPTGSRAGG